MFCFSKIKFKFTFDIIIFIFNIIYNMTIFREFENIITFIKFISCMIIIIFIITIIRSYIIHINSYYNSLACSWINIICFSIRNKFNSTLFNSTIYIWSSTKNFNNIFSFNITNIFDCNSKFYFGIFF